MNHPRAYGYIPDRFDARDHVFAAPPRFRAVPLPPVVDLSPNMPPVYDQGQVGSCTGNAVAGLHEYQQMRDCAEQSFTPSRLFLYYNARVLEGDAGEDAGAQIRDVVKCCVNQGVCPENQGKAPWPYVEAKALDLPPPQCYFVALDHQILTYERIPQTLDSLKTCLAAGHPFAFGMQVYAQMESAKCAADGQVEYPSWWTRHFGQPVGGHAVVCCGYDDPSQMFLIRNSWGVRWGRRGYFSLPYRYMLDPGMCSDFWAVNTVEEPE